MNFRASFCAPETYKNDTNLIMLLAIQFFSFCGQKGDVVETILLDCLTETIDQATVDANLKK